MADDESPYKKGNAYPESSHSDIVPLELKLSMAGVSGLAWGSRSRGRYYKFISTEKQKR